MPLMPELAVACREWQGKGAHYNVHQARRCKVHILMGSSLEDFIRPALEASNIASIKGLPVSLDRLPHFTVEQTREIVWLVAETGFRFEFCALDRRASSKDRLDEDSHFRWSLSDMQLLETAVCHHYTQAFWEYFGRAAVLLMRLEHELEKEDGEI
ncbi:hypothetical protein DFH08DRAFT_801797 [Mycena albidolilacea]|uniref:Uncharacterized protein n=1 Tax=Mycena albidolilacea TaxID=1033008 RepID=A0AAD7AFZ9_9AGAR|nr:hypothetical protein DFH08DRAFT_801797 [Mycena albidolilacea]